MSYFAKEYNIKKVSCTISRMISMCNDQGSGLKAFTYIYGLN